MACDDKELALDKSRPRERVETDEPVAKIHRRGDFSRYRQDRRWRERCILLQVPCPIKAPSAHSVAVFDRPRKKATRALP
ncbi:MAG: hypothetical protein MUF44_15795, partial [Hydrogenophaga sp.]|nr:hypothetical protein [Hydrogenophaga sp.]